MAGDNAKGKKRTLEQRRRELMHVKFQELEDVLWIAGEGGAVKRRRTDKEKILVDACERIRKQCATLGKKEQLIKSTRKDAEMLKSEKMELRSDKNYIRAEIEQLREENRCLRTSNLDLWHKYRKEYELRRNSGTLDSYENLNPDPKKLLSSEKIVVANGGGLVDHATKQAELEGTLDVPVLSTPGKGGIEDVFFEHHGADDSNLLIDLVMP